MPPSCPSPVSRLPGCLLNAVKDRLLAVLLRQRYSSEPHLSKVWGSFLFIGWGWGWNYKLASVEQNCQQNIQKQYSMTATGIMTSRFILVFFLIKKEFLRGLDPVDKPQATITLICLSLERLKRCSAHSIKEPITSCYEETSCGCSFYPLTFI